ncbi:hypothetical protein BGX33_003215 [Mortierella sp. NVP41]|nr:hypothetical protein BGX33_003215 [Mortierella sp. NVP41]
MTRALDMSEISYLIRQDLRGVHLKSAVLVSRLWWRMFAPYLWERVFIDTPPDQDDCEVLVRNGLAASSLTLSIYDPLDTRGVVSYVAERCRNVTALHLKLHSPELVTVDQDALNRRRREATDEDHRVANPDQHRAFGMRDECKTDLLDSLLSKLPYVSELTLSIAHEDLKPEVLWCVPTLTRLRKLTVLGGLSSMSYIVHKNRLCDWDLLLRVGRECRLLDSLSVSWESHKIGDLERDSQIEKMTEMFEALDNNLTSAPTEQQQQRQSVPLNEQCPRLRTLNVSSCNLHNSEMDLLYRSCPNLRAVEFRAVGAVSAHILEKNLRCLAQSCPTLRTFKFLTSNHQVDLSRSLLAYPTSLHSLTLSIASYKDEGKVNSSTLFGNAPDQEGDWTLVPSVTTLNILDITNTSIVFDAITTVAGLQHLTLDGYISDSVWGSRQPLVERLYRLEKDPLLRLPTFASQDTLSYLDISTFDIQGCRKLYMMLYRRIQELKQLKYFKVSRDHVLAANLQLTWSDDTVTGAEQHGSSSSSSSAVAATTATEADHEEEDVPATIVPTDHEDREVPADQDREKVFVWFPTVEHLYIYDTNIEKQRFTARRPFITPHMASALVRMMPKLKAMTFSHDGARAGLEEIIETCPNVSFNFMMGQK